MPAGSGEACHGLCEGHGKGVGKRFGYRFGRGGEGAKPGQWGAGKARWEADWGAHRIQNKDEEPVVEDKDGEVLRPNLADDKDPVWYYLPNEDSPQNEDEEPVVKDKDEEDFQSNLGDDEHPV